MKVNEIFLSVQGEGLSAGFPTIFVRFTGCNLRCGYCDTTYAYSEGVEMKPEQIIKEIEVFKYKRVCLTGGEPLLQGELHSLLSLLEGYTVTIETNGSISINEIKMLEGHSFVMDMKTPSSGCSSDMKLNNLELLSDKDEIKFVISDEKDFIWSRDIIMKYYKKGTITISPVFGQIKYQDLVEWILRDGIEARFQLQLHKLIWDPNKRGV